MASGVERSALPLALPGPSGPAPGAPWPALAAVCGLAGAFFLLSSSIGLLSDDFMLLLQVRDASWWEVLTLAAGPAPFQAAIWKLAPGLLPEHPYRVVHLYAAGLHALNTALAFRLLRDLGLGPWAWAGAAVFALHRPGNESVLQAASVSEVLVTSFALAALLAWRRREGRPRNAWLAALACAGAMLAKPSALGVPALLALHTLLLERGGDPRGRLRAAAPPLLAATAAVVLLALNALLRPGTWDYYGEMAIEASPLAALTRVGVSLFRVFALVYPPGPLASAATGTAVLLAAGVAFAVVRDARLRFGLAWAAGVLPGSLMVETVNASRYEHPAAFGVVLVLGTCALRASRLAPGLRVCAQAALALWLVVNAGLYAKDWLQLRRLGQPSLALRALLEEHREGLLARGRIVMVGQPEPYRVHADQLFRYDAGVALEVVHAAACPDAAEAACVEWRPPRGTPARCDGDCLEPRGLP